MATQINEATIYWDPLNEGWAFRVRFDDGEVELGAWDADCDGSVSQLEAAVVELVAQDGKTIDTGMVASEPDRDGGYATYCRDTA